MSIKHTATYQGKTWKCVTQKRKYSHMVVAFEDIADTRKRREEDSRRSWEATLGYYQGLAENRGPYAPYSEDRIESAKQRLAAGVEGLVKESLEAYDDYVAGYSHKTEDGRELMFNAGWTSRLDLAVKLAAKQPGSVILEAVQS